MPFRFLYFETELIYLPVGRFDRVKTFLEIWLSVLLVGLFVCFKYTMPIFKEFNS